jgi:DNA-nicking Smr family endonuclease
MLLVVIILLYFFTPSDASASKGWYKKFEEADSYEKLSKLKQTCYSALSEDSITLKAKDKWQDRLLSVIKAEGALDKKNNLLEERLMAETIINPSIPQRVHSRKRYKTEKVKSQNFLSNFEVNSTSYKQTSSSNLDKSSPYKIRSVKIDNRNPKVLDLHGVATAALAEKKVTEFINAAKSCRKKKITVITGKGNHLNYRGQRGTLFKAFPTWLADNPLIKGYTVAVNGGSYIVPLKHSLKLVKKEKYQPIKFREELFNFKAVLKEGNRYQIHQFVRETNYRERKCNDLLSNKVNNRQKDCGLIRKNYLSSEILNDHSLLSLKNKTFSRHRITLNDFLNPLQRRQLGL